MVTSLVSLEAEQIILGGGVLNRKCLLPMVREQCLLALNGYIQSDVLTAKGIESFITESRWGQDAGIVGAIYLAHAAVCESPSEAPVIGEKL